MCLHFRFCLKKMAEMLKFEYSSYHMHKIGKKPNTFLVISHNVHGLISLSVTWMHEPFCLGVVRISSLLL